MAALILLLLLFVPSVTIAAEQSPKCLTCHAVHYADRGSCIFCHRGNPATSRKSLAHSNMIKSNHAAFTMQEAKSVQLGKKLANQFACRRCHTLDGKGTSLAANLDYLLTNSTAAKISTAIKVPALYMPDFVLSQRDHDALISYILFAGLKAKPPQKEPPQVIYFTDRQADQQNIFEKKCGGCHKLLSARHGGLGNGSNGAHLAAIFTVFYPASYKNGEKWDVEKLQKWVRNPRRIRPITTMRPVIMTDEEWQQLIGMLQVMPQMIVTGD